jgi:hypothetical protein
MTDTEVVQVAIEELHAKRVTQKQSWKPDKMSLQ